MKRNFMRHEGHQSQTKTDNTDWDDPPASAMDFSNFPKASRAASKAWLSSDQEWHHLPRSLSLVSFSVSSVSVLCMSVI